MEKFFPILKQCPLFAHIAESDLSAMLHCLQVTVQHYDKGQIVHVSGLPWLASFALSSPLLRRRMFRYTFSNKRWLTEEVRPSTPWQPP